MKTSNTIVEWLVLFTLVVTTVFIIKYWDETQQMKEQMIKQNQITVQNIKASNMPLLDLKLEAVKAGPEFAHNSIQFAYDLILYNKGNGPAFNIITQRSINPKQNKQKIAIHPPPNKKIRTFLKKASIVGKGEKKKIYREHSTSYEYMKVVISYWDYFGEQHQTVFEGDRDGITLVSYPILKSFLNE